MKIKERKHFAEVLVLENTLATITAHRNKRRKTLMKAIVKKEPKEGLCLEKVSVPQIQDHEVLVKIQKTSICGTDVHLYLWDEWAQKTFPTPGTIGHEFVGIVVEIGKSVKKIKVGDRVSGEGHITCGHCFECRTGHRVLCPNTVGIGVNRDGCFAEYLALPEDNAFIVPKEIPDDIAPLFDPLGNTVHTALSFDLVGKDVLITGAGPIGLMAIPVVKKAGARKVVITDINDYRLGLAKKLQVDAAINVSTQDLEKEMSLLDINSFPVVLEMSGAAQAFETSIKLVSHGGKVVLLGILPSNVSIDWHAVIFKMITIKGIYGREIFNTWYQTLHMLQSGLDVSSVITHRFKAEEFQKGFDAMLSGECGKVILDWS